MQTMTRAERTAAFGEALASFRAASADRVARERAVRASYRAAMAEHADGREAARRELDETLRRIAVMR
jgi:hypothetical protein